MKEVYICPCCGKDISAFVHEAQVTYIRRRNMEKARAKRDSTPEKRAEQLRRSAENLRKWREENPGKVRRIANRAQISRTAESFARQSESMKETALRKTMKFAELMMDAKQSGRTMTPELEKELLLRARELVRAELKAERRAAKKKAKHADNA